MIKKFDNFLNEELKGETYRSAAHKLKALGGKHVDRSHSLVNWSRRPEMGGEYGMFNINMDAYLRESPRGKQIEFRGFDYKPTPSYKMDLVKKGPIECIYNPNGYMLFVRGDRSVTGFGTPTPTTLRTRGKIFEPNNLPNSISVSQNSYQSIGNPYASPINFFNISKSGGVQDVFYVWDPRLGGTYNLGGYQKFSGNGLGTYTVIPGGGSYSSGNTNIESGMAFFVRSDVSSGSLSFDENSKSSGSNLVSRPIKTTSLISKLSVIYNGSEILLDGVISDFGNRYSNNIDIWDYRNISGGEGISILRNGVKLVTERRDNISVTDTIFYSLNFKRQNYKLRFTSNNMNDKRVILYDKYLNTQTDIRDTISYQFSVTTDTLSSKSDRFYVVLYKKAKTENLKINTYRKLVKDIITNNGIVNIDGDFRIINSLGQIEQTGKSIVRLYKKGVYSLEIIKNNIVSINRVIYL